MRFFLLVICFKFALGYQTGNEWICENDSDCKPFKGSVSKVQANTIYENQNVCRLLCGKYGSLWPRPTKTCKLEKSIMPIDPNLMKFDYSAINSSSQEVRKFMDEITFQFVINARDECGGECYMESENELFVHFKFASESLELNSNTKESYQLRVTSSGKVIKAEITAENIFGARHGFETLGQLMTRTVDDMKRTGLVMVSNAEIIDAPKFSHRGLLLDTARHFIPRPVILKILDGMAVNKMNVFHWHITDSQSFPMESKRVPEMHQNGAYSEDEVYHKNEIDEVIEYAKYRGIRVILELDAPAHAGHGWEWGIKKGIGNLAVCVDSQPWKNLCVQPNCGQLNPANKNIYSTLRDIYRDIRDYKERDEFIHLGGDEVFIQCWNQTKEITDYMETQNFDRYTSEGFLQLWAQFQDRALKMWDEANECTNNSIVLWSSDLTDPSHIEKYLSKDRYIIQTWLPNDSPVPQDLISKGYKVIVSTKNAWYFDHGFWGITKYYNWKTVYENKVPTSPNVLGGEACMWTEYCDEHSVEIRIFPRLNGVAERLWSNPSENFKTVESRFHRQRERLISRGVKVDTVLPEYCTLFEGECR